MLQHPALRWPDDRTLALYVALQTDPYDADDRGMAASLWRMAELFDELEMRPSTLITPDVCHHHREVLEMGARQGWAWVVRGEESLSGTFRTVELVTGDRPRGWLKSLGSSAAALELVSELGATYVLDPSEDNQPCTCGQGPGALVSVPYTCELDDSLALAKTGADGPAFGRMLIDQFDVLHAESQAMAARVMSISVHPAIIGQPVRYKHFAEALRYMVAHEGVWLATTDDIADHYMVFGQRCARTQVFEEAPLG